MTDVFVETVDVLKENKVCVEVNTSGLRAPCKEIYPTKAFLKICCERGVPITLGSDSHAPENIGKDFDKALEMIKEVGYESIMSFNNKKPKPVKI
jgi:histidinol-phosphatase (PHP family)